MAGRLDFILRANADYIEQQYADWRQSPDSVAEDWALFFSGLELGASRPAPSAGGAGPVHGLVEAYRGFGHVIADLDPLGSRQTSHPFLELAAFGLTEADLDRDVDGAPFRGEAQGTLRQLIAHLRAIYCGTFAVEYMYISDQQQREWIAERLENPRHRSPITDADRARILRALLTADGFEQFLHARYTGQKRFSLEGGASVIPMFETLLREASDRGVEHLSIGMPHRGRLNFLANVMKKPLEHIFSEFESNFAPAEIQGHGDVKYHLGYSSSQTMPGGREIHLSLCYNPSHLEYVNPVVLGAVRARQEIMSDTARDRGIPVLMHGDAAFAGEGIVPETLTLAQLPAYQTGGTIHLIINNQVGFTTSPNDARPTRYPTALARVVDAPVLHVNGDDPEACVCAMSLALDYRMRFQRDVFIDLVCYRKHGHNEMDDPTFTQPLMYKRIATHVPAARRYAEQLVASGVLDAASLEKLEKEIDTDFRAAHRRASSAPVKVVREAPSGLWRGLAWAGEDWSADTRVARASLEQALHKVTTLPETFHPHRKIAQLGTDRRRMFLEDKIDWSLGETLAYGSLLLEGRNVRLTGQDSGRGTFTHRHAALYDAENGARLVPLQHMAPEQGRFEVVDTLLSEAAVLGFEYGFSTADPHTLCIWEAQFGDFANVAQVYMDQFIASGETKWGRMSGLTLFLPHGYEGQGPEHSSARLERFLELCADHNLQVCNLTTPAQLFHALRRQLLRRFRKPLVIMSPKSLLRHKEAVSTLDQLALGHFQTVIGDVAALAPKNVRRVIVCSGKVYYDLLAYQRENKIADIAVIRLEQQYPFPHADFKAEVAKYPNLKEVVWCQEEPQNQSAWYRLRAYLRADIADTQVLYYAGRPISASPAVGYLAKHLEQQKQLVEDAFAAELASGEMVTAH